MPIPLSTSPRRTRLLSFSCNLCGQRTLRRVNPVALETGTTFVQCRRAAGRFARVSRPGFVRRVFAHSASRPRAASHALPRRSNAECLVYHKLVDNLGLFHELEARTHRGKRNLPLGRLTPLRRGRCTRSARRRGRPGCITSRARAAWTCSAWTPPFGRQSKHRALPLRTSARRRHAARSDRRRAPPNTHARVFRLPSAPHRDALASCAAAQACFAFRFDAITRGVFAASRSAPAARSLRQLRRRHHRRNALRHRHRRRIEHGRLFGARVLLLLLLLFLRHDACARLLVLARIGADVRRQRLSLGVRAKVSCLASRVAAGSACARASASRACHRAHRARRRLQNRASQAHPRIASTITKPCRHLSVAASR